MAKRKFLGAPDLEWTSPYTQQGDCILIKCGNHAVFHEEFEDIPEGATKEKGNLVLKGNSNSHALFGGKFQLYRHDGRVFIDVKEATVLDHVKDASKQDHAEHHGQWIPPGKYFLGVVMEFDHMKEEARQVID